MVSPFPTSHERCSKLFTLPIIHNTTILQPSSGENGYQRNQPPILILISPIFWFSFD